MVVMAPLLLLLWVGVTVSTEVDLQKRIIGGRDCERQYHVILQAKDPDNKWYLCGGSLISNQWILTAAHCWKRGTIHAVLNMHSGPVQVVEIRETPVIYKDDAGEHDIMLLKLPNRVQIKPEDLPVLPDCKNLPKIGAMVQIAGHASTTMGPNYERQNDTSPTLQCANITVVDCQRFRNCLQNFPEFFQVYKDQEWFCVKGLGQPEVDISLGDSGGGVVFNGKIYGVIAFTGSRTHACVAPAAFMNICHGPYLQWIQKTIA